MNNTHLTAPQYTCHGLTKGYNISLYRGILGVHTCTSCDTVCNIDNTGAPEVKGSLYPGK